MESVFRKVSVVGILPIVWIVLAFNSLGCPQVSSHLILGRMPLLSEELKESPCPKYSNYIRCQLNLKSLKIARKRIGSSFVAEFDGNHVEMVLKKVTDFELHSTLQFSVRMPEPGACILTYLGRRPFSKEGVWRGDIYFGRERYVLKRCQSNRYVIGKYRIDQKALALKQDNWSKGITSAGSCPEEIGNGMIDIMVLYTDSARMEEGDRVEMNTNILHSISLTNHVFKNSGFEFRLNPVYTGEILGSIDSLEDGRALKEKLQGVSRHPMVAEMIRKRHADLVLVIVKNGDQSTLGYANEEEGIAILKAIHNQNSPLLFAHEVGHLLGAEHEEGTPAEAGVMSEDPDSRLPFFSGKERKELLSKLKQNAKRISGRNCFLPAPQVFIPDYLLDLGTIPSLTHGTGWVGLYSPYIYSRHSRDLDYSHPFSSEPLRNDTNYVYAMVRNGMPNHASGYLNIYWSPPKIIVNDTDLVLVGRSESRLLPPDHLTIVETMLPSLPEGCEGGGLVVEWRSSYPGTDTVARNGCSLLEMVVQSNKVAARASIDIVLDTTADYRNLVGAVEDEEAGNPFVTNLKFKPNEGEINICFLQSESTWKTFLEAGGRVYYSYTSHPVEKRKRIELLEQGRPGGGTRRRSSTKFGPTGQRVKILPPHAREPIEGGEFQNLFLEIYPPPSHFSTIYPIHIEQWANDKLRGSFTLSVHTNTRKL